MNKIVTLCPKCAETLRTGYKVEKIRIGATRTDKKVSCEICHKRYSITVLELYMVTNWR